jgi:hypothetical protein
MGLSIIGEFVQLIVTPLFIDETPRYRSALECKFEFLNRRQCCISADDLESLQGAGQEAFP